VGYARTVGRSVFALDLTKLRHWSAVRRGVVVVATFGVVAVITTPEIGALASVSSLYVGLQDRNASSTYTSRVMLVQSVLFAGVVLVSGLFSTTALVPATVLTVTAVIAGLAAEHDKAISRMFGDVMPVAAFLGLSTVEPREALVSATAVLLAGLAQAASARLTVRVEGDIIERRMVAAALAAVADHLDDALCRQRTDTGAAAEDRLQAASAALSASDLVTSRRAALERLLADAEVLRQEAASIRLRTSRGLPMAGESEVTGAVGLASRTLRAAAVVLTAVHTPGLGNHKAEAAQRQVAACREVADAVIALPRNEFTARSLARQTRRVARDLRRVTRTEEARDRGLTRRVGEGMRGYLLHPRRRDAVTAGRLGAATLVSLALAAALQVPHGSWVAATAVALLRPDRRALTSDTIARSLATVVGSLMVIPVVYVVGDIPAADAIMVFLLSTATFVIAQANEGLYVLAGSVQTIFTRAAVGEDPVVTAVARVEDVALGAAIAILFLLLIPVSHGRRLARDLARYTDATADWIDAVAGLAAGQHPKGWKDMRNEVRQARVDVQQGLQLRVIEPWGPGLSATRAESAFTHVHEVARVAATTERALKHGETISAQSAELAQAAASELRATSDALRRRQDGAESMGRASTAEGDDPISILLQQAVFESRAARRVVVGAAPGHG
jgi:uncharacterized membrane protein YccC